MSLQDQGQRLMQSAPDHDIPVVVMGTVVQMLMQVAQSLDHLHYAVLHYPDHSWVVLPQGWLPAFGDDHDAHQICLELALTEVEVQWMGVLELLFLALGLTTAQGLVIYDRRGDRSRGKTITRTALHRQLQTVLKASSRGLA